MQYKTEVMCQPFSLLCLSDDKGIILFCQLRAIWGPNRLDSASQQESEKLKWGFLDTLPAWCDGLYLSSYTFQNSALAISSKCNADFVSDESSFDFAFKR